MKKIRNIILCTILLTVLVMLTTTVNAASNLNVKNINVITDNTKDNKNWDNQKGGIFDGRE